jgi:hypothetical protein
MNPSLLNNSQRLTTLKAAIDADPVFSALPNSPDANQAVADALNANASPDFTVWLVNVPVDTVLNQITFASMTPADAPDGTQTWANRSLAAQGKQLNLQNLILGRASLPVGQANFRAALQDALTGLPTGAGGAAIAANWVGVRTAIQRLATRAEKLFATGTGTTGSPANIVVEGRVTRDEVEAARSL